MFDNFRKEWKIYKFIKQNRNKLTRSTSLSYTWEIDNIMISVYGWNEVVVGSFEIESWIVCFLINNLTNDKLDEERIKSNKRHQQREIEKKDKFLKEHNIK